MKNAVGREIPEEILKATGKEPFQGSFSKHLVAYQAATHTVAPVIDPSYSKVVDSIEDVLKKCGIKDGMTLLLPIIISVKGTMLSTWSWSRPQDGHQRPDHLRDFPG